MAIAERRTEVTKALLVRVMPREGKEAEVEGFLLQGRDIVEEEEPGTARWLAVCFASGEYGILDAFPSDEAREAHLQGPVAKALAAKTGVLFDTPHIDRLDVIAEKAP
ncbi:MAG: antibiotic biosynthesis monooxygenase [Thermoleophilia bacterium]|jgi:quinol monooxygenase YgiN|nr:antibiotic biosynthesis monooxygenase [Thermoleophilia bacterium]